MANKGTIKKGEVRNPGGRRKVPIEIKKAFEAACPEAVEILLDLMRNSDDDNVRMKAANMVIERHLGKPVQPIGNDGDKPLSVIINYPDGK
jgi:hypothetical protein